jgi:hypothetical protein
MVTDESRWKSLDALNGSKSEIPHILIAFAAPGSQVLNRRHTGISLFTADSAANVRNPEPVAQKRVAFGRPGAKAGSNALKWVDAGPRWTRGPISAQ